MSRSISSWADSLKLKMNKPSVFIGSSTEGVEFARATRSLLNEDAEITIWNEGFFGIGNTFLETLVNALPRFDFAVLVLTPDDLVSSRNIETFGPRDNVIFELGLFMGHLGRLRTLILHQAAAPLKIPTDLSGIRTATYDWPRADKNYKSAVGAACDAIRETVRDLGIAEKKISRQLSDIRTRVEGVEERISRIFAYGMSDTMFKNLKGLSTARFGRFRNSGPLRRELRYLRDIGYIKVKGNVGDLPDQGDDLSTFVTITTIGKEFVKLREDLEVETIDKV